MATHSGDPDPLKRLRIDFASMAWSSEETNSQRLASRTNFVLSACLAVLGAHLLAIARYARAVLDSVNAIGIAFYLLLSLSLILCLMYALWFVFELKLSKSRESASKPLLSSLEGQPDPEEFAIHAIRLAAEDLWTRNAERAREIGRAQVAIFLAFILFSGTIVFYSYAG